jgi:mutator protein MutT
MKAGKDYIGLGCGALIINDRDETLLMLRSKNSKNEAGYWSKPGGSVEYGETVEDAVKREIKEELGVEIELLDSLGHTNHIIPAENQHWLAISYSAKIVAGEPVICEPHKCDEIKWFGLDELPEKITQTTKEPIDYYLKSIKKR